MMTYKKMVSLYAYYEFDEKTWDMLYQMTVHGLIKREVWEKFFQNFKDVSLDEQKENAINVLTGEIVYRRDENTRTFNI